MKSFFAKKTTFAMLLFVSLFACTTVVSLAAAMPPQGKGPVDPNATAGPRGSVSIAVRVQSKGKGLPGAQVSVTTPDGKAVADSSGMTGAGGIFKVSLAPGAYVFTATGNGVTGSTSFTVLKTTTVVVIKVAPSTP